MWKRMSFVQLEGYKVSQRERKKESADGRNYGKIK